MTFKRKDSPLTFVCSAEKFYGLVLAYSWNIEKFISEVSLINVHYLGGSSRINQEMEVSQQPISK